MPRKPKIPRRIPVTPEEIDVHNGDLVVEVAENESTPASLKDRILGSFEKTEPEKKQPPRGRKTGSNDLIAKALPTVVNAFVVSVSRNLIPEPYKLMAPTKEEVEAILNPFFSLLSRRIKVSYQASQDALDIIASLTAIMAYGTRAIITYEIINKEVKAHDRTGVSTEDNRDARDSRDQVASSNGHAGSSVIDTIDNKGESSIFSELFRKDIAGRKQMGLLDRGI